jgi:hypothetical protein
VATHCPLALQLANADAFLLGTFCCFPPAGRILDTRAGLCLDHRYFLLDD